MDTDELYKDDPAYQAFQKEYTDHCRESGLHKQARKHLSAIIRISYNARWYHTRWHLLSEIRDDLDYLLDIQKETLANLQTVDAVEKILADCRSLIRYWEEPQYEQGLKLLEKSLRLYFKRQKHII